MSSFGWEIKGPWKGAGQGDAKGGKEVRRGILSQAQEVKRAEVKRFFFGGDRAQEG